MCESEKKRNGEKGTALVLSDDTDPRNFRWVTSLAFSDERVALAPFSRKTGPQYTIIYLVLVIANFSRKDSNGIAPFETSISMGGSKNFTWMMHIVHLLHR